MRFVGLEVVCILAHLFGQRVLYRDFKPSNLLLDNEGHVRLIDFGTAKAGTANGTAPPTSTEYCGSQPYMAPEIKGLESNGWRPYTCACDYYSFGVLMYELAEGTYPFGSEPAYEDAQEEYVQPELLDEHGVEVPHLYDLLSGLLDWDPSQRLGGTAPSLVQLKADPYWGAADWEIADARRLPSPLVEIVKGVAEEAERKATASTAAGTDLAAEEVVRQWAQSEARQAEVNAAIDAATEGNELSAAQQALVDSEGGMNVEGWEFVSEHAIAQEYISSAS